MSHHVSYHVAPRYTAGSPAMVPRATALRVAIEENEGYIRTMQGIYGEEERARAESQGLRGIVEERCIFAHHYIATDCLTGEQRDSRHTKVSP